MFGQWGRDSKSRKSLVNLLRRVDLLRRSIFSTAGSFGLVCVCILKRGVLRRAFRELVT